jgi:hypothetical protein
VIDIIIPLGTGSRWQNNELRYCLRSIEMYLTGYNNIYIVGEKPDWIQNVIHLPFDEKRSNRFKERNILKKVLYACTDQFLSNEFLLFNDDHFLLTHIEACKFPIHHKQLLVKCLASRKEHEPYYITIQNTLHEIGNNAFNYDTHCPIIINKELFDNVLLFDWDKSFGYCLKTLYCYANNITGEYYPDCKINSAISFAEIKEAIKYRLYFSMGDSALRGGIKDVLKELYPNKSRYEK